MFDNEWKEALIEECMLSAITWYEDDPKKTLRNLIQWNVDVAEDPRVSGAVESILWIDKSILGRISNELNGTKEIVASLRRSEYALESDVQLYVFKEN
jgi:hypothetical protein